MQVHPQIRIKNKTSGQKQLFRLDQSKIGIGREPTNYIVLSSKAVSRNHAEILHEGEQFFIRDLASTHGTFLNKNKIPSKEKILLRSSDSLFMGDFELTFVVPEKDALEEIYESTDTDILEVKMVKKLLKAMDRQSAPSLEVMDGPQAAARFVLEGKTQDIVIGRDPACEFAIDADVISRKHARVEKRYDTITLYDLKSKNGVYVNREKIKEKKLKDGDVIHLGTLTLSFRNPQELSADLSPPQIPSKVSEEPLQKIEKKSQNKLPARAARKNESVLEPIPLPENNPPPYEESLPAASGFSTSEVITALVGLLVLVGSLWGILKLLK